MIADTLRCRESEAARPRRACVHSHSEGNPFFVRTYLQSLHEQGVLTFDRSRAAWTWDLAEVQQAAIPDNVVDLVARRIATLSANTQALVRAAACIGGRFDLHLLARIVGAEPAVALAGL